MAATSFAVAKLSPTSSITNASKPKPHQPCFTFYSTTKSNSLNPISISTSTPIITKTAPKFSALPETTDAPLSPTPTTLKSRLAAGDILYGLFLLSASPTLAEIAGLAGYDFVVIDMEHGPGGITEALHCLRALAAAHTPAILRLPEPTSTWAKKALDLGPQGIMFPMINSPDAASAAVAACRYPPCGVRGAAHTIVRASAYGIDDSYLSRIEDDLLVMCQVETATGIEQIDAIAAVNGVDVVQMGPLDLSASMGYLWDPSNRKVREVLKEGEQRVLTARKKVLETGSNSAFLGGFAMQPNDPPEVLKMRGYHMVSGGADVAMFRKLAVEDVTKFRSAEVEIGEEDDEGKPNDESYWSE